MAHFGYLPVFKPTPQAEKPNIDDWTRLKQSPDAEYDNLLQINNKEFIIIPQKSNYRRCKNEDGIYIITVSIHA